MRDAFSDDAFGKMISNALRDERARRMLPSGFAEMVAADASTILQTARSKGGVSSGASQSWRQQESL